MDILYSRLCRELGDYQFQPVSEDFRVGALQLYVPGQPDAPGTLFLADGAHTEPPEDGAQRVLVYRRDHAPDTAIGAVGQAEFSRFFNDALLAFQRLISSPDRITERISVLARCESIQQHLDVTYELLEMPLLLVDTNHGLVAHVTPAEYDNPFWRSVLAHRTLPFQLISSPEWHAVCDDMRSTGLPALLDIPELQQPLLLHLIQDRDTRLGFLLAVQKQNSPSNYTSEILAVLGRLISGDLKERYGILSARRSEADHILDFLLRGNRYPAAILPQRMAAAAWHPRASIRVYVLHSASYEADDMFFGVSELLRDIPQNLEDRALFFRSDLVLVQSDGEPLGPDSDNVAQVLRFAAQKRLLVGISRSFGDIQEIHRHYLQARSALGLGSRHRPAQTVFWYEDFADLRLLDECAHRIDLLEICHPGIQALRAADRHGGTSYVTTLRSYLTHNRSISRTATALHIHRNTVTYRVERCLEVCGADLGVPEQLLHILLSLLILEYLDEE